MYNKFLKDISSLALPPKPSEDEDHFDVFQNYEIRAEKRDELKGYLNECGIGTLIQWSGKAIHHHVNLKFNYELKKTDEYFKKILLLPMNMFISDDDVLYIIEKIKDFYLK